MVPGCAVPVPGCPPPGVSPFLSTGIRLRLRFSSLPIGLGRVSLFTGSSILPRIFGPSSLSAFIFSMVGPASSSCTTGAGGCGITVGWGASILTSASSASVFFALAAGFVSVCGSASGSFSSFFLADFFGRVEESIVERSILLITVVPSSSGASILTCSATAGAATSTTGCSTGFGASATGSAAFGSSLATGFFSSFLNVISSSSFFFLGSACPPFGISTWSALFLATLSLLNSACSA